MTLKADDLAWDITYLAENRGTKPQSLEEMMLITCIYHVHDVHVYVPIHAYMYIYIVCTCAHVLYICIQRDLSQKNLYPISNADS